MLSFARLLLILPYFFLLPHSLSALSMNFSPMFFPAFSQQQTVELTVLAVALPHWVAGNPGTRTGCAPLSGFTFLSFSISFCFGAFAKLVWTLHFCFFGVTFLGIASDFCFFVLSFLGIASDFYVFAIAFYVFAISFLEIAFDFFVFAAQLLVLLLAFLFLTFSLLKSGG